MFSKNAVVTILVILSTVLFTSTTTNGFVISNETNNTDPDLKNKHFAIRDDVEILNESRVEGSQNKQPLMTRTSFFDNINHGDFFECSEQAQIALSTHSESFRNWEAFFKRNSLNDTIAVRYCCNLLEYVDSAQMSMSPECRDRVRLQDHVMTNAEVRLTCRQYDIHSVECFLVRWMYWWIPIAALLLIGLGIFCSCCAMKSRRNKSYLSAKEKKSLVTGI